MPRACHLSSGGKYLNKRRRFSPKKRRATELSGHLAAAQRGTRSEAGRLPGRERKNVPFKDAPAPALTPSP